MYVRLLLAQTTFLYITARAAGASIDATTRLLQAEASLMQSMCCLVDST